MRLGNQGKVRKLIAFPAAPAPSPHPTVGSIILIYSLLMVNVETRTFETGLFRMIGTSKRGVVMLMITNAFFYAVPAYIIGMIFRSARACACVGAWVRACVRLSSLVQCCLVCLLRTPFPLLSNLNLVTSYEHPGGSAVSFRFLANALGDLVGVEISGNLSWDGIVVATALGTEVDGSRGD